MKTLASNEVQQKAGVLSNTSKSHFSRIISFFENAPNKEALTIPSEGLFSIRLDGRIHVVKLDDTTVFFVVDSNSDGDYILILDVVETNENFGRSTYFATNNPKTNSQLNPKINSTINPKFNSTINPKFNSTINPKFNRAFGGPFLYDLNLIMIGYFVKANDKISFIFDLDTDPIGYTVSANEKFELLFSYESEWLGYFVSTSGPVKLRFDTEGEWIGMST